MTMPCAGLSQADVRARITAGQVNATPASPGRTIGQIIRANVLTRFNAILGVLVVVVLVVGPPQDALFGVVLVVNTGIGVAQEIRAKRALDRLAILSAVRVRVLREGSVTEVDPGQVVIDDVLELRRGDQVPVDGTVLHADGLELDEALLTGEAEPVAKHDGDPVLSGSFVVAGSGRARATAVGGQSYAVRLQAHARRFSLIRSELQQGTNQILRLVTWVMIPAGTLLIISEFFRSHRPLADAVRGSAAGVAAMVPEGLVLLTSLAFAAGALRLARRRVLVQELAAIEGLARVDVLCIDKTGTLTMPGMRLAATEILDGQPAVSVDEVLAAIAASDDSPNATMRAIAGSYSQPPEWAAQARVPFSSARKWSGVAFGDHGTWLLGAPGVVGGDLPPPAAASVARYQAVGQRVLVLAAGTGSLDDSQAPAGAHPVALLVLTEELREETSRTVRYLTEQGVRIKVLSGDAPHAVAAIAGRAGIPQAGPPCDASALTDEGIAEALGATDVFGRVRPAQKLAAVKALQAGGHIVAMVGDGVNDVQALKQADLGIAMGSGSDASRSVARVILLDGTFAAVPQLLAEARRVIANIERVAGLFVTKTVYAAIIAVLVGAAGIAYPFFPRHLTVISTLTIGVPGFFLALAAGAPRARPGFTRRVLAFTIPAGIAAAAAALGSYAIARTTTGTSETAARTATMLALLAVGLWVLVVVARRSAWRIALAAGMAACLIPLFAVSLARATFAVQLPPASAALKMAAVVVAAITCLTAWRAFHRRRVAGADEGPAATGCRPLPAPEARCDAEVMKVLVTAASAHGSTAEIARVIGDELTAQGLSATVLPPESVRSVADYDAVILGSAVYTGHWLKPATDFAAMFRKELAARPVWLFSSGPVGDPAGKLAQAMNRDPADIAGIPARSHRMFAGKLDPKELTFPQRLSLLVFRGMRGDFRDWGAVKVWASGIAGQLAAGAERGA